MPREQITYRKIDTTTVAGREVHTERDTVTTSVGWNRVGWVQVSLAVSTAQMTEILDCHKDEPRFTLYSEDLDRADINKLIRVLRKARDQAYGSDA